VITNQKVVTVYDIKSLLPITSYPLISVPSALYLIVNKYLLLVTALTSVVCELMTGKVLWRRGNVDISLNSWKLLVENRPTENTIYAFNRTGLRKPMTVLMMSRGKLSPITLIAHTLRQRVRRENIDFFIDF
jgi:hypothetical protein